MNKDRILINKLNMKQIVAFGASSSKKSINKESPEGNSLFY